MYGRMYGRMTDYGRCYVEGQQILENGGVISERGLLLPAQHAEPALR